MPKHITLTAFDIGTHLLKGLCARKNLQTGQIEILGQFQAPCFGVRNGEVTRVEPVVKTLLLAKEDLSKQAGIKIREAIVNISGPHLFSVPSHGLVSVSRADQSISQEDVHRVLKAAQAVNLPSNKEILDVLPSEFVVDGEEGVKNPLGLQGIRLEVKVLLVCVFAPVLANLEKVFSLAGIQILGTVPTPLASAKAVLEPEQKELGALVVDIGAGTTSASVFEKGELMDFAIFPIGSAKITDDIAICLRTEIQTAEEIKKEYGVLLAEGKKLLKKKKKDVQNKVELPEKSVSFTRCFLQEIVESRFEQIFVELQKSMKKLSSGQPLPAGVFFTGGGSLIPGLVDFAKQKLKLPSRLGYPKFISGLDDLQFTVCCGLLVSGFEMFEEGREKGNGESFGQKLKRLFRIFLP